MLDYINNIIGSSLGKVKNQAEIIKLKNNLIDYKVKDFQEVSLMSEYGMRDSAISYLSEREYLSDISYNLLSNEELNALFTVPTMKSHLCSLYLQVEQYQPIYKVFDDVHSCPIRPARDQSTKARAEIIYDKIDSFTKDNSLKALSILDIGSSLGYISNFIADSSNLHSVQGLDFDYKNIQISNLVSMGLKTGAKFKWAELDKNFVANMLPQYDVVLLLSVLHHINNKHDTSYVQNVVSSIVDKTPYTFLELAHKGEEVDFSWRDALPNNILEYFNGLPENGYLLSKLGDFPTHLSDVPRPLYLLERQYIKVSDNIYFYNTVNFEAHVGVHNSEYRTIHRYYDTKDNKFFIKECVELGTTENYKSIINTQIKYLSQSTLDKNLGIPRLVDYYISKDSRHSITVFEKVDGELLSNILHNIEAQDGFTIIRQLASQISYLDEVHLNHGDIRVWNIIYDKGSSTSYLIDFDSAFEVHSNNTEQSHHQNKSSMLWLVYILNQKTLMSTNKDLINSEYPSYDPSDYGTFKCVASDILKYDGEIKNYSVDCNIADETATIYSTDL